jgi:hypothetical protein
MTGALGFDERLRFSAADTLWWLFASPHTRPFRDRLPVLAGIAAADRGDPVLRFVQAEAIDASGSAFFAAVTPVAEELGTPTGVPYRYSGQYHLDRETGHIDAGTAFDHIVLDAGQRTQALRLFDRVFDAMAGFVPRLCRARRAAALGPRSRLGGRMGDPALVGLADHGVLLPQPRHGPGQVSAAGAPGRRAAPLAGTPAAPGHRSGGVRDDELPDRRVTPPSRHAPE